MDEQNMNPNAQNSGQDPYAGGVPTNGAPQGTPFTQGQQNPYANPYGAQGNPYGARPQGNPYGAQGGPQGNPYGAQPQGNPYAGVNPYAQAGTNPYAAPTTGTVLNGNAPVAPKPPKKKMPGWVKALIFGGVGAAALAVGLYFLFTLVIFPAKKTVDKALESSFTMEELVKTPLCGELGMDALAETIKQAGGEVSVKVDMDSAAGKSLKGITVESDLAIDRGMKLLSGETVITKKGETVLDAEIFADETKTYVTIEDMMNGYLALNNQNIISSLAKSGLLSSKEAEALAMMPDISLNYFGDGPLISGLTESIFNFSELWDQAKVSRAGKESLMVDGDSISATKYEVTIPKEALQDMLAKAMEQLATTLQGDQYADLLSRYGITGSQLQQAISTYGSMVKNMITEDFVYYLYLYDDKVVSFKAEGTLKISGIGINYNAQAIIYSGADKTVYSLNGSLGVMGQSIGLNASFVSKKDGANYKTSITGDLTIPGQDSIGLEYSHTYDPSTKKITGSGSVRAKGSTIATLSIDGQVSELTSGKSVTIDLSDVTVRAENQEVKFAMSATVKALDAGATVKEKDSSKKVVNVFEATRDEIKAIVDPESEAYKQFMERLKLLTEED